MNLDTMLYVLRLLLLILFTMMFSSLSTIAQINLNLCPNDSPALIPDKGGSFVYTISASNDCQTSQFFDLWCIVTLPDGAESGHTFGPIEYELPAESNLEYNLTQQISGDYPAGHYRLSIFSGVYPDSIWSSDYLEFDKVIDPPELDWFQTSHASQTEVGRSILQTADDGYIIAGNKYYPGLKNVCLVKTDAAGVPQWNFFYGGWSLEEACDVTLTSDGCYCLTGWTFSYGAGGADIILLKIDDQGNLLWERTIGLSGNDKGFSVQETRDGGFIIAGTTNSYSILGNTDILLVKTDSSGIQQWCRTYGGFSMDDGAHEVKQTMDDGYVMTGWTNKTANNDPDLYLVKTDEYGNELWSRTFGGKAIDEGYSVQQTEDGGYIIAGTTASSGAGNEDVYLIRTDSLGGEIWEKTFGGSSDDEGYSVSLTQNGDYIVSGNTSSLGAGGVDAYILRVGKIGNLLWSRAIGGKADDHCYSHDITDDGRLILCGDTRSLEKFNCTEYYIAKTSADPLDNVNTESQILVWAPQDSRFSGYAELSYPFSVTAVINSRFSLKYGLRRAISKAFKQ